jgi:hypothetical protein
MKTPTEEIREPVRHDSHPVLWFFVGPEVLDVFSVAAGDREPAEVLVDVESLESDIK